MGQRWSCLPAPLNTPNPSIPPAPPIPYTSRSTKGSGSEPGAGSRPPEPAQPARGGSAIPASRRPSCPTALYSHLHGCARVLGSTPLPPAHSAVLAPGCSARLLSRYRAPAPETPRGRPGSAPTHQRWPMATDHLLPQSSRAERPGSARDYPQRNIPREQDCSLGPNGKEERDGIKRQIMTISLARPGK